MGSQEITQIDEKLDLEEFRKVLLQYDFVKFTMVDIHGIPRAKIIPARNAFKFIIKGLSISSSMNSFGPDCELIILPAIVEVNYGNMKMRADVTTFHPMPWLGEGRFRTGQIFMEPSGPETHASLKESCPRYVAKRQMDRLAAMGYSLLSGLEWEFTLLDAKTRKPVFQDHLDFHSTLLQAQFDSWFCEVDKNLHEAGVNIEMMHTELGFGQFEFTSAPEFGIKSADSNVIFKQAIKEMAMLRGWEANFMAKINRDHLGSGGHFNFSVWDKERKNNVFYDKTSGNRLSKVAQHWIGGMVKHAGALTALCCPSTNCYERIHIPWTPHLANWGIDDRFAMLRVRNDDETSTYIENRVPSGLVNPYLALAGIVAAGLDGVINKTPCPGANDSAEALELPHSLQEALTELQNDKAMVEALGESFVQWFVQIKTEAELKAIEGVTDPLKKFEIQTKQYGRTC